ncbi:putative RNA helicase [Helianthus anomalus]
MVGWHRHVQTILLHVGKRAEKICYTHATFSTSPLKFSTLQVMAGAAPEGSQIFSHRMMKFMISFDAMGLQENLLRGIYAYGTSFYNSCGRGCLQTS